MSVEAETRYDALELQVIDQEGYEYIRAREGVSIDRTVSAMQFNVPLAASLFVKKPA